MKLNLHAMASLIIVHSYNGCSTQLAVDGTIKDPFGAEDAARSIRCGYSWPWMQVVAGCNERNARSINFFFFI